MTTKTENAPSVGQDQVTENKGLSSEQAQDLEQENRVLKQELKENKLQGLKELLEKWDGKTAQEEEKPYICGTMTQDELEEATAEWFAEVDNIWSDEPLGWFIERCKIFGPDAGYQVKVRDQIWECMLNTVLKSDTAFMATLVKAEVFDRVDLQKVCKQASALIFEENTRLLRKGSTLYNPAVIGLAFKRVLTDCGLTIHGKGVIETDDESETEPKNLSNTGEE